MQKWIAELNEKWDDIENNMKMDERNVQNHIVIPFLKGIGYKEETVFYDYEYKCRTGFVDVYLKIKGSNDGVYVETKRANVNINSEHIKQIVSYMDVSDITWGILTNGRKYYLIHRDIITERSNEDGNALLDKVVLICSLKSNSKNEREAIKYFSKEYLFDSKKTLFMKDIAQFKAYKTYQDWAVYFSTLFGFFNYYCEEIESDLIINTPFSRSYLSDVREKHFKQYLLTLKPKNKSKEKISQDTIRRSCSHITEMYHEFERRNLITINNFRETRANMLEHFIMQDAVVEDNIEVENYLTNENVSTIVKNFSGSSKNGVVIRLIIFGLVVYYGFTKSQVVEFLSQSWDCVIFDDNVIEYQGTRRYLPPLLFESFKKIKKTTGKKKNILGDKGERGQSISSDIVAATFNEIKKMKDVEGRKYFTPEYTRKMMVIRLFESGFSIEEISGYVGISLNSIEKIIGKDVISKTGLKRWNMKTKNKAIHPFKDESC